jgi:hypothetical protein
VEVFNLTDMVRLMGSNSLAACVGEHELVLSDHNSIVDMCCVEGTHVALSPQMDGWIDVHVGQIMPLLCNITKAIWHNLRYHMELFTLDGRSI